MKRERLTRGPEVRPRAEGSSKSVTKEGSRGIKSASAERVPCPLPGFASCVGHHDMNDPFAGPHTNLEASKWDSGAPCALLRRVEAAPAVATVPPLVINY